MKNPNPKKLNPISDLDEQKFEPAEDIAHREIEGQILLLLPEDQFLYTFNAAGSFVWKRILKKQKVAQITRSFAREFAIDAQQAASDVGKLLRDLEKKGIIVKL
jgi:hypothetical protein